MKDVKTAAPLPGWIQRDFPYDRYETQIDGVRIAFVDHGPRRAPMVLLVHGNPMWSFLWRKVIAQLGDFRVVAPDLRGFGTSDKPLHPSGQRLERHITDIATLIERLEPRDLVIAGQDWGGPISVGVGERHSSRLRGIVLGNTAVVTPARPFRPKAFHRFSHLPLISDLAFRGGLFPLPLLDRLQGDRASLGWKEKAAYGWPHRWPHQRSGGLGLARMVPNSEDHPSTATMDRIGHFTEHYKGPAALVWGERDPVLGRSLKRHRQVLPQASVRVTQAGHFTQEEIPDEWAAAIHEVAGAAEMLPKRA